MKKKSNYLKNKSSEIWGKILQESDEVKKKEPILKYFLDKKIHSHNSLQDCLGNLVAENLDNNYLNYVDLRKIADFAINNDNEIISFCVEDILAYFDRDPACTKFINPILYYKGFQALECYRISHFYSKRGEMDLAYFIQMLVSNKFSVDIHPSAKIGKGILMDHAHGIVIGETAKVGDNVSFLHSVTLGGTGKEEGDRHPKIGNGVLLGAGAKVLGNIVVGDCAKIASGSVVLIDVPDRKTVAGIPAKIVGEIPIEILPSRSMDHKLNSDI